MKRWIFLTILAAVLVAPEALSAQHQAKAGVPKGDVKKASEMVGTVIPIQRMEERGAHVWKVQFAEESPRNPLQLSSLGILMDAPETFQAEGTHVRAWVIDELMLAGERYTLLTCSEERASAFFAMGLGRAPR